MNVELVLYYFLLLQGTMLSVLNFAQLSAVNVHGRLKILVTDLDISQLLFLIVGGLKERVLGHFLLHFVVHFCYLHIVIFINYLRGSLDAMSVLVCLFLCILCWCLFYDLFFFLLFVDCLLFLSFFIIGAILCIDRIFIIELIVLIDKVVLLSVGDCFCVEQVHTFFQFP